MTSPDLSDWEVRRQAQIAEYGTYVAIADIDAAPGVRAYNVGDPVPASNVEEHGYLDAGLVAEVDNPPTDPRKATKASRAKASAEDDEGPPISNAPQNQAVPSAKSSKTADAGK